MEFGDFMVLSMGFRFFSVVGRLFFKIIGIFFVFGVCGVKIGGVFFLFFLVEDIFRV